MLKKDSGIHQVKTIRVITQIFYKATSPKKKFSVFIIKATNNSIKIIILSAEKSLFIAKMYII